MKPKFETSNALSPIYAASDRNRPELIGSATLLDFGKARFLVTAAHVVDWTSQNSVELYTFGVKNGRNQQIAIPQQFTITPLPESGNREDDKLDFAFIRLDEATADQIAKLRFFLPFGLIDANDRATPTSRYMFTGYPLSREKTDYGQRKVIPKGYSLTEITVAPARMMNHGFHTDTHIAVNFDPNAVQDEHGQRRSFPCAKGISGGPVWRGDGASDDWLVKTPVRLVGIGIEDRVRDSMMVAVRIHLITAAIGDRHPDLRDLAPRRAGFSYSITWAEPHRR
ncbi:MAG: hypothetical protein ABMA26_04290 [Limisphaerales bacterium]